MGSGSSKPKGSRTPQAKPVLVPYRGRNLDSHPANNRGVSYIKTRARVVHTHQAKIDIPKEKLLPPLPKVSPAFRQPANTPRKRPVTSMVRHRLTQNVSLPCTHSAKWERSYPEAHEAIVVAASMFAWRLCEWKHYQAMVQQAIDNFCVGHPRNRNAGTSAFSLAFEDIFALKTSNFTHIQLDRGRAAADSIGWKGRHEFNGNFLIPFVVPALDRAKVSALVARKFPVSF